MVMNERYLYTINPKKIIKRLADEPLNPPLKTPKTLNLTKEQVRDAIRYGSVYRRFANENRNERVTTINIDRLHNAKYMSGEEYEKFVSDKLSEDRGNVFGDQTEEPETPTPEAPIVENLENNVEVTVPEGVTDSENNNVSGEVESVNVPDQYTLEYPVHDTVEVPVVENPENNVEVTVLEGVTDSENNNTSDEVESTNNNVESAPKNYGGKNKRRH